MCSCSDKPFLIVSYSSTCCVPCLVKQQYRSRQDSASANANHAPLFSAFVFFIDLLLTVLFDAPSVSASCYFRFPPSTRIARAPPPDEHFPAAALRNPYSDPVNHNSKRCAMQRCITDESRDDNFDVKQMRKSTLIAENVAPLERTFWFLEPTHTMNQIRVWHGTC